MLFLVMLFLVKVVFGLFFCLLFFLLLFVCIGVWFDFVRYVLYCLFLVFFCWVRILEVLWFIKLELDSDILGLL